MDWIRRMFGYSDKLGQDNNSFRNPTWEDIFENHNYNNRPQPPDDSFKNFHWGRTIPFGTEENVDSFSTVFGQMDDMFRQLDAMMQNFHGHPGHMIITEGPDMPESSEPQSPRDSFLKKPDIDNPDESSTPRRRLPFHRSPFHGPIHSDPDSEDGPFGGDRDDIEGFDRQMRDPFSMMDDLFKGFGEAFRVTPFMESPGVPMLPGPGTGPGNNPRDSLVKKEDTDLDDKITGGFSEMLKDMPKYDPPVVPGQPRQPSISPPDETQPQPRIQQRYHSTSIVRIRRPDGSVEETRKYTDSTGREEVTVTQSQPEDGNPGGSLLRQGDSGVYDGHHPPGHVPSLFSWIFTR